MKNINRSYTAVLSLFLPVLFMSCIRNLPEGEGHSHGLEEEHGDHGDSDHGHDHNDHGGAIYLSKDQIKSMNIKFGAFSEIKINDFVKATGTLGLPPNAVSSLSAPANGYIKGSKKYVEGSYVKQGSVIAYLENPEFIKYQQVYLETAAELDYLRLEYQRQKDLVDAEAGVLKSFQKLESEVKIKEAILKSSERQLSYLGIRIQDLTVDNIVERVPIYAPMSGYITSIPMHNGMYVTPSFELLEIVNENHLHLELDVFEGDIAKVTEEQKISYTIPALGDQIFDGLVHVIGREFDMDTKTVRVHGHLENDRPKFIKNLFINAKIWLNDQTVQAVPEQALYRDGAESYIYITDQRPVDQGFEFNQIRVIPGLEDDGYVSIELIDEIPGDSKIVTNGAYYVFAQSVVGELEHSH